MIWGARSSGSIGLRRGCVQLPNRAEMNSAIGQYNTLRTVMGGKRRCCLRLHLSRASIVKYVPGEVRPPPTSSAAERGWAPSRCIGRATEMERPYVA
jgi:hypothetical protein